MVKPKPSEVTSITLRGAGFPARLFVSLGEGRLESPPHKGNDTYPPDSEYLPVEHLCGLATEPPVQNWMTHAGLKQ